MSNIELGKFLPNSYPPLTHFPAPNYYPQSVRGFHWGYWNYPGGHWLYPPNRGDIFYLPYSPYPQGTCRAFGVLDLTLLEDEDITENVILSIFSDNRIPQKDKLRLKVESENGKVVLSGNVDSRATKAFAYSNAFATPGVKDVENRIKIPP